MDGTALRNAAVEKHRALILETERYIWKHPETGYREVGTSAYMAAAFEKLGYELVMAGDIPGFYTVLDTGRPGPEVLVLGELDSLICADHPESDPKTGAVHCCGHNAQCAALLGLAAALKEPGVTDEMCGKIRLCVVPAEELIEIGYRNGLRKKGIIHFFGGKQEFLRRGYFEGVDAAFMIHTTQGERFSAREGSVGCVALQVHYKGVSAHAGGAPQSGRNALYAATLGLQAINSIRETFREKDIIRVHPIITKGGDAVNAIPSDVRIESYIRGKTFEAIEEASKRVNRALTGAALAIGTNVEIIDLPGYGPMMTCGGMVDVARDAMRESMPDQEFGYSEGYGSGSTDMGDLSQVMPAIHAYAPGASGKSHGSNYEIADPELACVASAKWQLAILQVLLRDGGKRTREVCAGFTPAFPSQKAYVDYLESICTEGDRIAYSEDETTAQVTLG